MSYDLFFKPRLGTFDRAAFHSYFDDRPQYKCEGGQAWYNNQDTGVYFVFEFQGGAETNDGSETEHEEHFPLALNINYFRPSYFVLEAEPEVTALVKHFDLLVSDPQLEGMGEGEYSAEKLVSGWNLGNTFGYSAILKDEGNRKNCFHLPRDQLHHAWRWNLSRAQLQARLGESKFVPRIMFISLAGSPVTVAVWPDGIPVVVEKVDYLYVPRKELAPRVFFRKVEDVTLVAWDDALPVLLKHGTQIENGAIRLDYETPPSDMVDFIRALPKESRPISGLSADNVLDRELYQRSVA